jgi:cyclopropane-fatty-acyl-phospholipid synthase
MAGLRERKVYEQGFKQNVARNNIRMGPSQRAVFFLLGKLSNGFIVLHDGGSEFTFGDSSADIKVEIHIHDPKFYRRLLVGGSIGAAESYIEGQWSTSQLTDLIRIFSRNLGVLQQHEKRFSGLSNIVQRVRHSMVNRNSKSGSRTNIAAHYDLSNDFYRLFLDPAMQYSSAIFPTPDASLELAQQHKMKLLCERLDLTEKDHLLEVGTGWGGLACYAAEHYGCTVTTTTISKAQYDIAQQRIVDLGLQDKVTLLLDDYRDLNGQYSKIVSVEMIEAVGHEFMPEYFRLLDSLLAPGGKLVIQAITIEDQRYDDYRKSPDFIQRYIFPGGHLPSVSEICRHIKEQTSLRLNHFSDYGHDYADTLKIWNDRFMSQRDDVSKLGFTEDFTRLWHYYFCYCEGAFRENVIGLAHIETTKSLHA